VERDHWILVVDEKGQRSKEDKNEDFPQFVGIGWIARLKPRLAAREVVLVPGNDEAECADDLAKRC
jgi:hypothetical protein